MSMPANRITRSAGTRPLACGLVLAALCCQGAGAAEPRAEIQADWAFQHRRAATTDKSGRALLRIDPGREQPAPLIDEQAGTLKSDRDPTDQTTRRTDALLAHLAANHPKHADWAGFRRRFDPLLAEAKAGTPDLTGKDPARQKTYLALCALRREIAFSNPWLDFDDIVFSVEPNVGQVLQRATTGQYSCIGRGHDRNTEPGGGLYLLRGWKGGAPQIIDLCKDARVENGPYRGQPLTNGVFHAPSLSYDGTTVFFSWAKLHYDAWPNSDQEAIQGPPAGEKRTADPMRIFRISVDGTGLRQIATDEGRHNDTEPCEMPDGRILFMSTRREVYDRCIAYRPAFTLCSMKPDGSDILPLSRHETHEWLPSISHDGMIFYTRWDYVDRATGASHGIWTCYPDGRDPRAPNGNYLGNERGLIFNVKEGPYARYNPAVTVTDKLRRQPTAVSHIHAVPGSRKVMAIGSNHHVVEIGPVILLDLDRPDDYQGGQIRSLTPGPWGSDRGGECSAPWPLSENFFLANCLDRIYLTDRFGNRELVVRSEWAHQRNRWFAFWLRYYRFNKAGTPVPDTIPAELDDPWLSTFCYVSCRPTFPRPVRPRPRPPVIPPHTYQSEDSRGQSGHRQATIAITNVYDSDVPLPEGVKISRMRLVQVLGCSSGNYTSVGGGNNSSVKLPLGTVPVESDGSVYCLAPIDKGVYFQLLDENGLAVQSMLSVTYVHAGERLSCRGCHESYRAAPPAAGGMPLAFRRAPSPLTQESSDGKLHRIDDCIRPAVDRVFAGCVACHQSKGKGPRGPEVAEAARTAPGVWRQVGHPVVSAMEAVLEKERPRQKGEPRLLAQQWIWTYGGPVLSWIRGRTVPDRFGARSSKIWEHLQQNRGKIKGIEPDDLRLFALWLDLLCVSSSNWGPQHTVQDAAGNVWPRHPDLDVNNPLGLEVVPPKPLKTARAGAE
jgi:hypothetical protein